MKLLGILIIAGALSASAAPCAAETNRYTLSGFTEVEASNHVRVVLRQGPYSVTVEEPNGRFDALVLSVRGSTLVASRRGQFGWSWWGLNPPPRYTITVTAPSFTKITATDHSRISASISGQALSVTARDHGKITGAFTARTLVLAASDHGDLTGELDAGDLTVSAYDHGEVRSRGRCEDLRVVASDHGDFLGADLACDTADAQASGHANVAVRAARTIRGRAYDHGDLDVHGAAAVETLSSSDHGSIRRL